MRFQQIQKYEYGGCAMSATRILRLAKALNVPVDYFFDGLPSKRPPRPASADSQIGGEASELARIYQQLDKRARGRLQDMASSLLRQRDAA